VVIVSAAHQSASSGGLDIRFGHRFDMQDADAGKHHYQACNQGDCQNDILGPVQKNDFGQYLCCTNSPQHSEDSEDA